jgi:hypothetical protein
MRASKDHQEEMFSSFISQQVSHDMMIKEKNIRWEHSFNSQPSFNVSLFHNYIPFESIISTINNEIPVKK